jgi:hypothetical protein
VLSVPVTVNVYVPFAAFTEPLAEVEDAEPPPPHPDIPATTDTKTSVAPIKPKRRDRNPNNPTKKMQHSANPETATKFSRPELPPVQPKTCAHHPSRLRSAPTAPIIAPVPQRLEEVFTVIIAVTAVAPDTVTLGTAKQAFAIAGLLVTVNAIVPVYPFCGVTVIVDVPEPPAATVVLLAVKPKLFADALPTVTESVPLELAYVASPEYVAEMVCAPIVVEVNVNAAAPLTSASVDVCVAPSTATVSVPVGVTVLALEADATIIVITSLAPEAGVNVAADKLVVLVTDDVVFDPGHALNKLKKSTEPSPLASSYPVVAENDPAPAAEQRAVPAVHLLLPTVMS